MASPFSAQTQQAGLNIVVLDPAHGGTDPGARGTGGIRESEIVLDFAIQVRRALELQGFQVVQTRQGNENPSFDDRSATANAQRGAVFVTLHISSTGLPGTVRVYVNSELPPVAGSNSMSAEQPGQGKRAGFCAGVIRTGYCCAPPHSGQNFATLGMVLPQFIQNLVPAPPARAGAPA